MTRRTYSSDLSDEEWVLLEPLLPKPSVMGRPRTWSLRDILDGIFLHPPWGKCPGCLLVCVAPLVDDAEVRQFLQYAVAGGAALVERRFSDAISAGELPSGFPAAARATQVVDLSRGLTVRAQMGTPRKTLLKDAEEAAELVLLPWREHATPEG
ncbi:transposase [Deinococcus alpinitundrae]|uniref:transposase n=1 Tax=Deinococcus alpinitundrae TaxID=468913 RepID=UPI00192A2946